MYTIIKTIIEKYGYIIPANTKGINLDILSKFISDNSSVRSGGMGYTSSGGISKFLHKVFPDKINSVYKNSSYISFLLSKEGLKVCSQCNSTYSLAAFNSNIGKHDKLSAYCKSCDYEANVPFSVEKAALRRARKLQAMPLWADINKIKLIYARCPKGYHVDHTVPLVHDKVCGLHNEFNLAYLTAKDNLKKSNTFNI